MSSVFAASITSVTFTNTGTYLDVGGSTEVRIDPDGAAYCRTSPINGITSSAAYSCGGDVCNLYTVGSGHTNRVLNAIPFTSECCDNEGMTVGCTTVTVSSNGTPGVDTQTPYITSVSFTDDYLKNGQSTTVTVNFNETILNVSDDDFSANLLATFSDLPSESPCSNTTQCTLTMTINSAGNYTGQTIRINGALYTDIAGKNGATEDSAQTFTIDNTPPTLITLAMGNYSLKPGQSTALNLTFKEDITGFDSSDVTAHPNLIISNWTKVSDSYYTATLTARSVHDEDNAITIGTGYTDKADNSPLSTYDSSNYTITPPYASSGTYNANEGSRVLTIAFDDTIDASLTDLSMIHIRQSGSSSDGVTLTGAAVTDSDSTTLTITTTEAQRIAIKQLANAYGTGNLEIDLDAGAVSNLAASYANEAEDNDNDISYTQDTTKPLISSVTVNDEWVGKDNAGTGTFYATIVFNEAMNIAVYPVIDFVSSSEDEAKVASSLDCAGSWASTTSFIYTCDVTDANVEVDLIDIRVTYAKDIYTNNQMLPDTKTNKFNIDTIVPTITITDNNSATWVISDTITASPSDGIGINNTKWIISDNATCNGTKDALLNSGTVGTTVDANNQETYYNKYICFRTQDNADNNAYISSGLINRLDTVAPTVNVGADVNSKELFLKNATTSDTTSGIETYLWSYDTNVVGGEITFSASTSPQILMGPI